VHRPRRSLGQNFLTDPNIQRKIADAILASADSTVLEIGPGHGAITDHLAGTIRRLVAVEIDRDLAATLRSRYSGRDDVEIVQGDILETPIPALVDDVDRLTVAGNIPYNITTPIVFRLLERENRPAHIVLMVQREVAERITAAPGGTEYGALSVGVQAVASVERLFIVGRNAFRPAPNVDSMVIRITPLRPFRMTIQQEADLRTLTRTVFNWRRKQLQRTLRSSPEYRLGPDAVAHVARASGIGLDRRPETLSPDEFGRLADALSTLDRPIAPVDPTHGNPTLEEPE
jgi:16S rRNA (adenine1518-N6/adenine1519-N6)-dimethyltransferase